MCFFPHTPDKFTSTEKMILEFMSSHRDEFLFMTIGQLSAALNISEATVSRFARHVGCDDFKHLKQVVMEQTVRKGPAQKLSNTLRSGNGELLCHCISLAHSMVIARWSFSLLEEHQERFFSSTQRETLPSGPPLCHRITGQNVHLLRNRGFTVFPDEQHGIFLLDTG